MSTIAQNSELLKHLFELLQAHRGIFKQRRTYQRVVGLMLAELFVLARHTITQLLMSLGQTEADWSSWYRVFSQRRFRYEAASEVMFEQTLQEVAAEEPYVVAVDGTQTPRSSRKLEGSGWLRNLRTPRFKVGIHAAQRWFNGSWLMPAEGGYSRALPIRWLAAFTAKSQPRVHEPKTESEAAYDFLVWLRQALTRCGRARQQVLCVGDGTYDNAALWQRLPAGVTLLARSARNRVLHHLPTPRERGRGRQPQYGPRTATPQALWRQRRGWQKLTLDVRGRQRHLQVKVQGVVLRRGAPDCPLFLIVVRGKANARTQRDPLPFLVNAQRAADGSWHLPFPLATLLFWAWQRWEIEVCHRELKSSFGLGNKQCFNPYAAVASVQWSAWAYAVLLLAGYRTLGLTRGSTVPTRWWRGSQRWSLTTLWRTYRAAFWHPHVFHPVISSTPPNWGEKQHLAHALRNAVFAAARS